MKNVSVELLQPESLYFMRSYFKQVRELVEEMITSINACKESPIVSVSMPELKPNFNLGVLPFNGVMAICEFDGTPGWIYTPLGPIKISDTPLKGADTERVLNHMGCEYIKSVRTLKVNDVLSIGGIYSITKWKDTVFSMLPSTVEFSINSLVLCPNYTISESAFRELYADIKPILDGVDK